MADEDPQIHSTGAVDESTLVPVERDRRFLFRLVALLVVGGLIMLAETSAVAPLVYTLF